MVTNISNKKFQKIRGYEKGIRIDGAQDVIRHLEKYMVSYKLGGLTSLKRIMMMLREAMDNEEPKIPVDTGNLRSSWFTTFVKSGPVVGVVFGFRANYSLYVHEMIGADFTSPRWRYYTERAPGLSGMLGGTKTVKRWYVPREGAGPKFMEAHLKNKKWAMHKILLDEMRARTKRGVA
jgi:hypothetical protein